MSTTKSKPRTRGPLLLKNLTGTAFDNFKYLAKDDSWLQNVDNGQTLLNLMNTREYYGEDSREDMLNCLGQLTYQIKRNRGESQRDFCVRWENVLRKVREHGVQLPPEYLGFLLIMALQLSMEEVKLLMNYCKGSLKVADVKEWLRVHETELDFKMASKESSKSSEKKGVYYMDPDDPPDHGPDAESESDYEVLLAAASDLGVEAQSEDYFDEDEAKEILATMVKDHNRYGSGGKRSFSMVNKMKKTKELSREYGSGRSGLKPGTYRVSISELKRRTRCSVCNQTGHWHKDKECPGPQKGKPSGGAAKEIQYLESDEALFIDFLEFQDYKAAHEVHHLSSSFDPLQDAVEAWRAERAARLPDRSQSDGAYRERPPEKASVETLLVEKSFSHLQRSDIDESACATVDTGCQRAAIGLETLKKLKHVQPNDMEVLMVPETHRFCSVHGTSSTSQVACIPTSLGPNGSVLRPAVFEEEHSRKAPFLLSLPFLLECRAVLELDPERGLYLYLRKFKHRIALHLGPTGALRIPLHEFTPQMKASLSRAQGHLRNSREHEILNVTAQASRTRDHEPERRTEDSSRTNQVSEVDKNAIKHQAQSSHGARIAADAAVLAPICAEDIPRCEPGDDGHSVLSSSDPRPRRTTTPSNLSRSGDLGSQRAHGTARSDQRSDQVSADSGARRVLSDLNASVGEQRDQQAGGNFVNHSGTALRPLEETGEQEMPLQSGLQPTAGKEGRHELHETVLEMPALNESGPGMQLLHVDGGSTTLEGSNPGLSTELQSSDSSQLPTSSDHQGRFQRMDCPEEVSGLWRNHREGASETSGSSGGEGSNGLVGGIPSLSEVPTEPEPEVTERSAVKTSRLKCTSEMCKIMNPVHWHRIDTSIEAAQKQWELLLNLLGDPTKFGDENLLKTIFDDVANLKKSNVKTVSQLFYMEPSSLKRVAEVFNPDRFGPYTSKHGLNRAQAFDIVLGHDMLKRETQEAILSYIRVERPGLTVISPPCGPFSPLQNLTEALRERDWEAAKKHMQKLREARNLLRFAARVCHECHRLGLSFLFEHPRGARSWSENCIRSLLQTPGIELVHGDQCMLGLVSRASGLPIKKPTSFLSNNDEILETLGVHCDRSHEHQQIIGSDCFGPRSKQAQEYPQTLVEKILRAYATSIKRRSHQIQILSAETVIEQDRRINRSYFDETELSEIFADVLEEEAVQPFYGSGSNEFTEMIKNLIPEGDWKFWTRTDFKKAKYQLSQADGPDARIVEFRFTFSLQTKALIAQHRLEDLEELEAEIPSGEQDLVTVFVWQKSRELAGSRQITLERLVRRAHEGLGHPEVNRFLRILKASRVKPEVLEAARKLRCSVCHTFQPPATRRHAAPPRENLQFNDLVGVDTVHLRDPEHNSIPALNLIDYASHFQMMIPLASATAQSARSAYRQWIKVFGVPRKVYGDLGGEFKATFLQAMEEDGTEFIPSSLESPYQRGLVERSGKTFKNILYKTMNTLGCDSHDEWLDVVNTCCMMRNRLLLKGGYSPIQRVLGFTPRLPGEIWAGRNPKLKHIVPERPGDLAVLRSMEIRKVAAKAFFDSDCQQALQRSLYAGPRPWRHFEPGQLVYFFRRGADTSKKPTSFYWRGPARVLLVDTPNTIWLSFQSSIVKASPERVRHASEEETQSLSQWLEGLTSLRDQLGRTEFRNLIDLHQEDPPQPEELEDEAEEPKDALEDESEEENLQPEVPQPLFPAPARRVKQKTSHYPVRVEPDEVPIADQQPDLDEMAPIDPPPPAETSGGANSSTEITTNEAERNSIKREAEDETHIEGQREEKRQRLEFLEVWFTHAVATARKRKECKAADFTGRDFPRLQKSITKEINQNLESKAYKLLTPEESAVIWKTKRDKIMGSRYVLSKKPLEECDVDKARLEDLLLDDKEHGPVKAKCRHVMQGFSEPSALDVETTTPQVTRDAVVFISQVIASLNWVPGFLDFTQAFHSGDGIDRELYAMQPKEGIPGAGKDQLIKLLKHCYGLTDGPHKWYEHLCRYLKKKGYVQSRLDPCMFFLFGGQPTVEAPHGETLQGIIGIATDDILHGGTEAHWKIIEQIATDYKLGKNQTKTGRFTGKDICQQEDGSISIGQQTYVEDKVKLIPLDKRRKHQRFDKCNSSEIEALRGLLGVLSWLSKETRCDLAGRVALLQQSFPHPKVKDLEAANRLASEAIEFKHLGILVKPIPLASLRIGVVTDASWGNSRESSFGLEDDIKKDYWEDQGDFWVRHHREPRRTFFHPECTTDGPTVHELQKHRQTTRVLNSAERLTETDSWNDPNSLRESKELWTGTTTFWKATNKKETIPSSQIRSLVEQRECLNSQGGQIVVYYDKQLTEKTDPCSVTLASWRSYRLKRKVVSTLGAESQALVNGVGSLNWHRLLLLEVLSGILTAADWEDRLKELPFISVTDSKSLYDSIKKDACPAAQFSDKRVAIDISILRDEFRRQGGLIRWIDTRAMIADSLTKDCLPFYLRHIMEHGQWSIMEEGVALQKKCLERLAAGIQKKVRAV